ncbi:MAG: hypothetical protein Q4F70_01710 [Clostridia bacterium]|nr:hypothetical protein [Clostridia bacterium]
MAIVDLTKESIRAKADDMIAADKELADAIEKIEDVIEWLKADFDGQNELAWIESVQNVKVSVYDLQKLVKQQADKLDDIANLFDA